MKGTEETYRAGGDGIDRATGYFALTRTATYGFLAALPLLIVYELLILIVNEGDVAQVRVGADVWIKQALASLGGTGMFSLGILVLLVGIAVYISERKKRIPVYPEYFAGLVAEGFLYAVVVAILVSNLVAVLFPAIAVSPSAISRALTGGGVSGPLAELGTGKMLVLSIGAGLYEELIFRVLLVGGLFLVFKHVFNGQITAYLAAALIGALAFSAVHYLGTLGDPFQITSFMFRFFFGLALNAIFLVRGFGLAAWTHALYDVLVVTHLLS
jgi:membrane protease YdiL (CAAX protease family)